MTLERTQRVAAERKVAALRTKAEGAALREAALRRQVESLRKIAAPPEGAEVKVAFPPGHFYSPIPDLAEVRKRQKEIFDRSMSTLPGIDLRVADQLALLPEFGRFYPEMPFEDAPVDGLRYGFVNRFFGAGSGVALYSMLRHLNPPRLVEVGSGWSSALALDVNDRFLGGAMQCTFVDPYPERLKELLRPADHDRVRILETPLYDVGPEPFEELAAGDLLFIDSTHVSRIGSDVNRLLLEVIPTLPAGVYIHIHDVFWPFEYPENWVYGGRAWNENYLLRALLIDNPRLQVVWFNDFLYQKHYDAVAPVLPQWARGSSSSLYLRTA